MKLTIYTVPNCQFSKAEKEYLGAHNVQFEEKNLESNKEFLTEMLAISNNFAGTPVTKVEKDDGQISILKGYTKEEFDKILGVGQPKEAVVNSAINIPPKDTKPAAPPPPTTPVPQTPPPASSVISPATPPTPSETTHTPDTSDALTSVLENLQSKSTEPTPPATQPQTPTPPQTTNQTPAPTPNIPEPDFK